MSKAEFSRASTEHSSVVDEIKKHGRKQDAETDSKLTAVENNFKKLEENIAQSEKEREILKKH